MTTSCLRPFGVAFLPLFLAACEQPVSAHEAPTTPVLGIDLGRAAGPISPAGAHEMPAMPGHTAGHHAHGGMVMAHAGHGQAQASGTINSVDPAARTINLSHGPIAALGWPAMTMDFAVAPGVDLKAIKSGSQINFTIKQGEDGMYVIQSVAPASGGAR
jgi:Cu(I)/Ag(I) efflux system periplasmic protein CusF